MEEDAETSRQMSRKSRKQRLTRHSSWGARGPRGQSKVPPFVGANKLMTELCLDKGTDNERISILKQMSNGSTSDFVNKCLYENDSFHLNLKLWNKKLPFMILTVIEMFECKVSINSSLYQGN